MKESYQDKSSKDTQRCLSKRLFMGKFGLSEQNLKEGVAEGEFLEMRADNGATMYSWNESSVTNKKGEKSAMGWESSSTGAKGSLQKFDSMVMNWKVGIPLQSLGSGSGSSGSQAPLALMDADAPLKEDQ
eukprot:s1962_g14.t1